mmetsp:Transcript_24696/g.29912  ORF Transcript_24696/g.29912 Transcript_24696/m.29912 type:complete len:291 (-) Transcript_24696:537-1409(-)|eukprot:CAMPEP_0197849054 /NCGR_PEP_ID=MMETSP1438-20131217/10708_1 /TAXON_ID=1461541 /ORGANISM="Pterosperma sp., Strain CCMP1384" /LENGTH=290 /DNA_ID=CAMNT_0043461565 /DNA_START=100 /DNA_END=972 /DNA_ORIENTATION=+
MNNHEVPDFAFAGDHVDSDDVSALLASVQDELKLEKLCTGGLDDSLMKRLETLKAKQTSLSPASSSLLSESGALGSDHKLSSDAGANATHPEDDAESDAEPSRHCSLSAEAADLVATVQAELAVEREFPSVPGGSSSSMIDSVLLEDDTCSPSSSIYAALPDADEVALRIAATAAQLNSLEFNQDLAQDQHRVNLADPPEYPGYNASSTLEGTHRNVGDDVVNDRDKDLRSSIIPPEATELAENRREGPSSSTSTSSSSQQPSGTTPSDSPTIMGAVQLIEDWFTVQKAS